MILELDILFFLILFLILVCLGTMITLLRKKVWLFAFIPLTLFIVISIIYTYSSLLGTPTKKELPKEFFVTQHLVSEEEQAIYLWVLTKGNTIPVAYQIEYNVETKKQLRKMMGRVVKSNGSMMIKGTRKKNSFAEFELYEFVEQEDMKKDVQ